MTLALLSRDAPAPRVRKRSISAKRGSKALHLALAQEYAPDCAEIDATRPRTWGECQSRGLGTTEPCPYLACAHHLALDVNERTGALIENFPGLDFWELPETCSLAVAAAHPEGVTLDLGGPLMNLTRERFRQLESVATETLHRELGTLTAGDLTPDAPDVTDYGWVW